MIALNDFRRQWLDIRNDANRAFEETGASGWYVLGPAVRSFEEELARYWGVRYTVGVASGLDAIEISLRALGCSAGDRVLTTPVSAFATTLAILRLGAIPVFVDTENTGLLDLQAAEETLRADRSIRFFVPVHLYGHALDMDRLARISSELDVMIVEDCAQCIGAQWNGKPTGRAGRMSATSFYPTKNLGAMGDAGAILTDNPELAARATVLRDYGQTAKYDHSVVGYNSRLDELQASLLFRAALPRLDQWTGRRREIAARYCDEIRNRHVRVNRVKPESQPCWHLFPVTVDSVQKVAFIQALERDGVLTGQHYPVAIPDQGAMVGCRFEVPATGLENARRFCSSEVSLPIHPYLTEDEISTVIKAVNRFRP